jgi:uncharacterized ferritin-like protein (DUF455 family)
VTLSLFEYARRCIDAADVDEKLRLTHCGAEMWRKGLVAIVETSEPDPIDVPGRPARPPLVHPSEVKPRKLTTRQGRAAFLHALAHIEFNAINLAWDAAYRFRGMPVEFYADWIRVAVEEARHFTLLRGRLTALRQVYGDFPDGLWHIARETAHDVLARLALVPRLLEARGLDVTPAMIARLLQAGDTESATVLESIIQDEIGHVEIGTRWFHHLCRQRGLHPVTTFRCLLVGYSPGRIRAPFNTDARRRAGFTREEMAVLEELALAGR